MGCRFTLPKRDLCILDKKCGDKYRAFKPMLMSELNFFGIWSCRDDCYVTLTCDCYLDKSIKQEFKPTDMLEVETEERDVDEDGVCERRLIITKAKVVNDKHEIITVTKVEKWHRETNKLTISDPIRGIRNDVVCKEDDITSPGIYSVKWYIKNDEIIVEQ